MKKIFNMVTKFHGKEYEINLQFRNNLTVVTGDSASGKTFLYNMLKNISNDGDTRIKCYNYDDLSKLISEKNRTSLGLEDKLVIIDNADIITEALPWIVEELNMNGSNFYIIIGRSLRGVTASPNVWTKVKIDNNKVYLEYVEEEGVWW